MGALLTQADRIEALMAETVQAPRVFLDTSALRGTGWASAPFRSLMELSAAGRVEVLIPEIVFHERRTQWRADYQELMQNAELALGRFARDVLVQEAHQKRFAVALDALPRATDAEALSTDLFDGYFERHRVKRLPVLGEPRR